jgi:hypothetical protein
MRSIARNPNGRGRFRCFAALMLLFVLPLQAGAQPSVVGYYEELRQSGAADDLTYALREEGKRWVTTSPDWGTPMPVTVDGPRGYMRILDDGTGGGSFETQVVLWRQADDLPLLGIAETFLGPLPERTRLRFFGHDRHRWDEITDYSWPGVSLTDFMTPEMTVADLRALEAIRAAVYVELPRQGLRPAARLVYPVDEVSAVCDGADWFVPADPAPYLRFCRDLSPRLYRRIAFEWDPVAVQFRMGAKSQ